MRRNKRIITTVILGATIISLSPLCTSTVQAMEQVAGVTGYIDLFQQQLNELKETNTYEYYKLYKETILQLPDSPETIYDYFKNEDDILIIQKLVEAEMEGEDFDCKVNVANVVINRIVSEGFGDTAYEVLTEDSQFSSYSDGRYKKLNPTQETIDAVEYAFLFEDTTNDSMWCCNEPDVKNMETLKWFKNNLEFVMKDSSGTSYFKFKGENNEQ